MKKKLLSFLLILALTLPLMPQGVLAAETDGAYDSVEAAGSYLREQMVLRRGEITVPFYFPEVPDQDAVTEVFQSVMEEAQRHTGSPDEGDYLAYQISNIAPGNVTLEASGDGYLLNLPYVLTYETTRAQEQAFAAEADRVLGEIAPAGMEDYDKALAIYDYILDHVAYDYDHPEDGSYGLMYTAYAALMEGKAVCEGYALLFYYLCNAAGLDCRYISGYGAEKSHAWNIVKLGDYYYNADTTWDAVDRTHAWFLKGSDSFKDHYPDLDFTSGRFTSAYPISEKDFVPGQVQRKVYFDPGEGWVDAITQPGERLVFREVTTGEPYGDTPAAYRYGHRFLGWYTAPEGGRKILASDTVSRSDPETFYAHWTPLVITLTLDPGDGKVDPASITYTGQEEYGPLPDPTITSPARRFSGWYTEAGLPAKTGEQMAFLWDHTLRAVYTVFDQNLYEAAYLRSGRGDGWEDVDEDLRYFEACKYFSDDKHLNFSTKIWHHGTGAVDTAFDLSKSVDLYFEESDVYGALVMELLDAACDMKFAAGVYGEGLGPVDDMLSYAKDAAENFYQLEAADDFWWDYLTPAQKLEVHETVSKRFGEQHPLLSGLSEGIGAANKALSYAKKVEAYYSFAVSAVLLQEKAAKTVEVLRLMAERCPEDNPAMKQALADCVEIAAASQEELAGLIQDQGWKLVGRYSVEEGLKLWKYTLMTTAQAMFPKLAFLKLTYDGMKLLSNTIFSTDDLTEKATVLRATAALETLVDTAARETYDNYTKCPTKDLASVMLSALDLRYAARDLDLKKAGEFADTFQEANLSSILFNESGRNFSALCESRRSDLRQHCYLLRTQWIEQLALDYPGLYEKYDTEIRREVYEEVTGREYWIQGPAQVRVYDTSGALVACAAEGELYAGSEATLVQEGENTYVYLHEGGCSLEVEGDGGEALHLNLKEQAADGTVREMYFRNLNPAAGEIVTVPGEGALRLLKDGAEVLPDYDSLDEGTPHTVTVTGGYLADEGLLDLPAEMATGKRFRAVAYLAEGTDFGGWVSNAGTGIFDDPASPDTYVTMPDQDLHIGTKDTTPLTWVAGTAPTCTEHGTLGHWTDGVNLFRDESGTEPLSPEDLVLSPLGHSPGEPVRENESAPACEEAGHCELITRCTVCGQELSRESIELPATGHTPGEPVQEETVSPTCEEPGRSTMFVYCTDCGQILSQVETELPALGHDWGDWAVITPATYEEEGLEARVCLRDDDHRETRVIPMREKDLTYVYALSPSCEEPGNIAYWTDGTRFFLDSNRKKEISEAETILPATGHNWGQWYILLEPTETYHGWRRRVCENDHSHTQEEMLPPLDTPYNPFIDVHPDDYYYKAVLWALDADITAGTSAEMFSPNRTCTRAQVVSFLWRAAGRPEPMTETCPFTDVPESSYYYRAVLWAVENGITKGTSDISFSPGAPCTRGQIVSFLYRAAEDTDVEDEENPFLDVIPSSYYYKAVLWAVDRGITYGTGRDTFSPNQPCLRSQVVAFLYRFLGDS